MLNVHSQMDRWTDKGRSYPPLSLTDETKTPLDVQNKILLIHKGARFAIITCILANENPSMVLAAPTDIPKCRYKYKNIK